MRVIDCLATEEPNKDADLVGKSLPQFKLPLSKDQKRTRELVINAGKKILNDNYCLLCDLSLSDNKPVLPFLLLGPTGAWIINTSQLSGVVRVAYKDLEMLDQRSHQYRKTTQNPISETFIMQDTLMKTLASWNLTYPNIETVLFFPKPGLHIERSKPVIKVILADGIDRFLASLLNREIVFEKDSLERTIDILSGEVFDNLDLDIRDDFSFIDIEPENKPKRKPIVTPNLLDAARGEPAFVEKASRKVPFSRKQWIMLGILLVFNIFLVSALIIVLILIG
jgi:hypothetical protein